MNELITQPLLQAAIDLIGQVILVVFPIIIARLIVWGKEQFENIKRSQPEFIQQLLERGAQLIIREIEQEWLNGKLEREEMIDEAISKLKAFMKSFNYDIDETVIRSVLEGLLLPTKVQFYYEKQVKDNLIEVQKT